MAEGSLYDRELAALAIKQARGDLIEAIFLRARLPHHPAALRRRRTGRYRRAWRCAGGFPRPSRICRAARCSAPPSTTPTGCSISHWPADLPARPAPRGRTAERRALMPRVADILGREGLIERRRTPTATAPGDLTREPLRFPADRDLRLQNLARGDEGFLLALGYSTQRGYGRNHPFAGEIRFGEVEVEFCAEELGFAVRSARSPLTECQMVNQFKGSATEAPPQFTRGYGLAFGQSERKAMSMALVDRALARRRTRRGSSAPRRRTRNSCCRTPTMCRRPASSSISSCRITSISSASSACPQCCARNSGARVETAPLRQEAAE